MYDIYKVNISPEFDIKSSDFTISARISVLFKQKHVKNHKYDHFKNLTQF